MLALQDDLILPPTPQYQVRPTKQRKYMKLVIHFRLPVTHFRLPESPAVVSQAHLVTTLYKGAASVLGSSGCTGLFV